MIKMVKLTLLSIVLLLVMACAKVPPVELPTFEPLPDVQFVNVLQDGEPNGLVATATADDTQRLFQREQLRNERERMLMEMLRALGAVDPTIK